MIKRETLTVRVLATSAEKEKLHLFARNYVIDYNYNQLIDIFNNIKFKI